MSRIAIALIGSIALCVAGCAALQQLSQTANDVNKTANDVNKTANDVDQAGKNVANTVERADTAANKVGGIELEDDGSSAQGSETWCCVNGAFYTCGTAAAASQCVGDPMTLMQCLDGCPGEASCEDACGTEHGPDPSACQRDGARDAKCGQ